ncbi:MAG: carbonic anhydrase [Bacteroidia bacterium]
MNAYEKLLLQNRAWSEEKLTHDADFFKNSSKGQSPDFLWIGCSDSRVPVNEITGTDVGEIFVHRNVANLVVTTDLNLLSVLQYSVEVLEVEHIIVCGHYGCGGVKASMSPMYLGLINKWIRRVQDVYRLNQDELDAIEDENKRADRLVELNVIEQCHELARTAIVQKAWSKRKRPTIHGWVYGLNNGLLHEIVSLDTYADSIEPIYKFSGESLWSGASE